MASRNNLERTNVSMNFIDSRILDGYGFYAVVGDADLDIAVPLTLTFSTPDDPKKHVSQVVIKAKNTNPATIDVLEGPTVTADTGSDITPLNRKRSAVITSGVESIKTVPVANQATKGVTITVDGTSLRSDTFGIAATNNEYIVKMPVLKLDTVYTVRLTTTVDDSVGDIQVEWLEYVYG